MPWEEKTVEKTRLEFVSKAIQGNQSMSSLCREYGISRKTGYKWIQRYKEGQGLSDKSHAPINRYNKTPEEMEAAILEYRDKYPAWGGRKLKRRMEDLGYTNLPAASTISNILKRNDRISKEESEKRTPYKRFEYEKPNELWQMDYKGHFGMLDGNRCNPLTITDDCSRFNLCLDANENQRTECTIRSIKHVFYEYGLPDAILCDNGYPWGNSNGGYTPIEIWFMQLGILPIHGRIGHPQTQGKGERFHETMEDELLKYVVIKNLKHGHEVFNTYRYEYNYERPHHALNLDTPAKHYHPSKRIYIPGSEMEPEYDTGRNLRKVNCKGYLSIRNHRYYFGEPFIGKTVELRETEEGIMEVLYGEFRVAVVDMSQLTIVTRKIIRAPHG